MSNPQKETPAVQATAKISKNVQSQQNDNDYKANLRKLRNIVSQASPIIENKEQSQVVKDENGKEVDQSFTTREITGYNYYAIDGKEISEWVKETFGGKVTLDKEKKQIIINDTK